MPDGGGVVPLGACPPPCPCDCSVENRVFKKDARGSCVDPVEAVLPLAAVLEALLVPLVVASASVSVVLLVGAVPVDAPVEEVNDIPACDSAWLIAETKPPPRPAACVLLVLLL